MRLRISRSRTPTSIKAACCSPAFPTLHNSRQTVIGSRTSSRRCEQTTKSNVLSGNGQGELHTSCTIQVSAVKRSSSSGSSASSTRRDPHAVKKGRRYRYYVSVAAGDRNGRGPNPRLAACSAEDRGLRDQHPSRREIVPTNPAAAVSGPKHVVKTGKTLVLEGRQWRKLLQCIPDMTLRDMRDRALIATLTYSFARIGAALNMKVEDLRPGALGGRSDCTKKAASSTPYPAITRWLRLCARISTLQGLLKTARAGYSAPVAVMTVRCCPRNRWASRMRGG
jgi:integrase